MPWQLIYTSAPRGLTPGQSGFCTVARSTDIREALAQRLEQISYYEHARSSSPGANVLPVISAFRILDLRGSPYYVLTRIRDAGLDFTNRTNHLAHHLIFDERELASLPDPAAIFLNWNGWRETWSGEPRILPSNVGNLAGMARRLSAPAQTWASVTGEAARAAALIEPPSSRAAFLLTDDLDDTTVLRLFSESLRLLDPEGANGAASWHYPFTTHFQGVDLSQDFVWRCCESGTPGLEQAVRSGQRPVSIKTLPIPGSPKADLARTGVVPSRTVQKPAHKLAPPSEPLKIAKHLAKMPVAREDDDPPVEKSENQESIWSDPIILYGLILLLVIATLAAFGWPGYLLRKSKSPETSPDMAKTSPPAPNDHRSESKATIANIAETSIQSPLLFQVKESDIASSIGSTNPTTYFFSRTDTKISDAEDCLAFWEFRGSDWQVHFHPDPADWSKSTSVTVKRDAKTSSITLSHSKGSLSFDEEFGVKKLSVQAPESQNFTFVYQGTPARPSFRLVYLGRNPILELRPLFASDAAETRVTLSSEVQEMLHLALPNQSLSWRLQNSNALIPVAFDVGAELAKARADFEQFNQRIEAMKRDVETELKVALSTNAPDTFGRYLQQIRQQPTASGYCSFLAFVLRDKPVELSQALNNRLQLGLNRHEILRKVHVELSNRFPSTISALPEDHLITAYNLFDNFSPNSAFRQDFVSTRARRDALEQFVRAPSLILVASGRNGAVDVIRVLPKVELTP